MQVITHRGSKEIGGTSVEIASDTARILIDGSPADIKNIDAIFLSHFNLGLCGLSDYISPDIPTYMSKGSEILIKISGIFAPIKVRPPKIITLMAKKSIVIGELKITPYLVDHSMPDALAFLIEGEGKKVFYPGDSKGQGRNSALFRKIAEDSPNDIDCLLMDDSMPGREGGKYQDERSVQKKIEEILREGKKINFISISPQDIDRITSAYKACLKSGSIFIIDIYTAFVLDMLRKVSAGIPQLNRKIMRIMFFHDDVQALQKAGYRGLLYVYNKNKITTLEINRSKGRFLIMARNNLVFPHIIKGIDDAKSAKFIYLMQDDYLKEEFTQYCAKKGLIMEEVCLTIENGRAA